MLQAWRGVWFLGWVVSYRKTGFLGLDCISRLQTPGQPGPFPPPPPPTGSHLWLNSSGGSSLRTPASLIPLEVSPFAGILGAPKCSWC